MHSCTMASSSRATPRHQGLAWGVRPTPGRMLAACYLLYTAEEGEYVVGLQALEDAQLSLSPFHAPSEPLLKGGRTVAGGKSCQKLQTSTESIFFIFPGRRLRKIACSPWEVGGWVFTPTTIQQSTALADFYFGQLISGLPPGGCPIAESRVSKYRPPQTVSNCFVQTQKSIKQYQQNIHFATKWFYIIFPSGRTTSCMTCLDREIKVFQAEQHTVSLLISHGNEGHRNTHISFFRALPQITMM